MSIVNSVSEFYGQMLHITGKPKKYLQEVKFVLKCFRLKMVVRPKHVADNLNKIVKNY
jgi:hypothetical protein